MNGFFTRYIIQVTILCFLNQMLTDFQKLIKGYEKVARDNGKTKFAHWFYDLSFKSSVVVSLFSFGLFFCLIYPQISIVVTILLCMQLYLDKYNLMYVYPLDFESQVLARKTLVKNSFLAVIWF